jgi:hypothetical protein
MEIHMTVQYSSEWDRLLDSILLENDPIDESLALAQDLRERDDIPDIDEVTGEPFEFFEEEVTDDGIELQNRSMLRRQKHFRLAADYITGELKKIEWVARVALFGSVAHPLKKEIPRFQPYRRERVSLWHECMDLDLAIWVRRIDKLNDIRRARILALAALQKEHPGMGGVAHHQVDIFFLEPETNRFLGNLCNYGQCPREGKPECRAAICGKAPFLKTYENFSLYDDALTGSRLLYENPSAEGR